jgi:hypothetical protein
MTKASQMAAILTQNFAMKIIPASALMLSCCVPSFTRMRASKALERDGQSEDAYRSDGHGQTGH